MIHTNEFKAFKKTIGFCAIVSILATLLIYSTLWIPVQYFVYAIIIALFGAGFWLVYSYNLHMLKIMQRDTK